MTDVCARCFAVLAAHEALDVLTGTPEPEQAAAALGVLRDAVAAIGRFVEDER